MSMSMLAFLLLNLFLSLCSASYDEKEYAVERGSIVDDVYQKLQSANSNISKNQNQNLRSSEASMNELERAIPLSVSRRMRCSIEENVTVKPELGAHPLVIRFDATAS